MGVGRGGGVKILNNILDFSIEIKLSVNFTAPYSSKIDISLSKKGLIN